MPLWRTPISWLVIVATATTAAAQILPTGATAMQLVTGYGFTEGPPFDPSVRAAGSVLFTDLNRSDIVRYDIAGGMAAIADPNSGAANGVIFNAGGQLVSADRDRRQISRRTLANLTVVEAALATHWAGAQFNGPNDLVIDASGGIYFSDPDYNNRRSVPVAVYYINPAGVLSRPLTGFQRPNGVVLSPDGYTFYLAAEAQKRIYAFDVAVDGVLTNQREFARTDVNAAGTPLLNITNGPDGLTVDAASNAYAAAQSAVFAWNPSGARLFSLAVPQDPTNVELGGRNGKTLYITAATSLYSVNLNIVPELPGDFDYDGAVDANGDGAADGTDFLIWQRQLDAATAAGFQRTMVVPEPVAWWSARLGFAPLADGARFSVTFRRR